MHIANEIVTYIFLFIALYFEVFLLITYFESREHDRRAVALPEVPDNKLPSVAIIVPCWNEEATISKTIFSLLKLNYPKNKLTLYVVDDGSTDNSWKVLQRFARNKQVKLLQKQNEGGKHAALNYALKFITEDYIGCLDADSFVHPEALRRIIKKFSSNPLIMAVTPSIKIHEPKTVIQLIQKVEYGWGILLRNMFARLNGLYVTPGPFSFFKRAVFQNLGGYRKAHNTEDMELALRMHLNGYKIDNAPDAFVYTVAPSTVYALYKQRLRWTYGFMKNVLDYRQIFFRPQYGHLGMIILPAASISAFSSVYIVSSMAVSWAQEIYARALEITTVGLNFHMPNFDWFYMNTDIVSFASLTAFIFTIILLFFSRRMAEGNSRVGLDMFYFIALYALLAPLWITKSFYNVLFARQTKWR